MRAFLRALFTYMHFILLLFVFIIFNPLHEVVMLGFSPLGPNEVTATRELLVREHLILLHGDLTNNLTLSLLVGFLTTRLLAIELFLLLVAAIPPGSPANYLPHWGVVVPAANVEAENLSRRLRLRVCVFMIKYLVELDQQLLVHRVEKIWHLKNLLIENDTIAAWDRNLEIL